MYISSVKAALGVSHAPSNSDRVDRIVLAEPKASRGSGVCRDSGIALLICRDEVE